MSFYINGNKEHENTFWRQLHNSASQQQIYLLLEGKHVMILGKEYYIREDEPRKAAVC